MPPVCFDVLHQQDFSHPWLYHLKSAFIHVLVLFQEEVKEARVSTTLFNLFVCHIGTAGHISSASLLMKKAFPLNFMWCCGFLDLNMK